jgi:4-alpha-glucanotransferase
MHPTSLPGGHGVGDLGPEARAFARFLRDSGQTYWQMLPVCPTGPTPSPYDSPSASALNPLLVSLQDLEEAGLVSLSSLGLPRVMETARSAKLAGAASVKHRALREAHRVFRSKHRPDWSQRFDAFRTEEHGWLGDHCLFAALSELHPERCWTDWDVPVRDREPGALRRVEQTLTESVEYHAFVQFVLHEQWQALKRHCTELGLCLMGDVPIYVAHNSVDVWAHREVFCLDESGHRRVVAGVPPDYFCAEGQLWGNPLYRWSTLEETRFDWWVNRFRTALRRFDTLRLDHFVGFVRFWEIPGDAPTARIGRYVEVPGEKFLSTVLLAMGSQPFLAEDLGVVTSEVHQLRHRFNLPGMKILLFAFDDPNGSDYLPHRFEPNTAVYTGTHDNDTVMGWYHAPVAADSNAEAHRGARARALRYVGSDGHELHWDLMRAAFASVANTAIVPVQDVLGLGHEARMNVPGTTEKNWAFRLLPDELSAATGCRLRELTSTYERLR